MDMYNSTKFRSKRDKEIVTNNFWIRQLFNIILFVKYFVKIILTEYTKYFYEFLRYDENRFENTLMDNNV